MAYDWNDARTRLDSIKSTLEIDGELHAVIRCGVEDARAAGIMMQTTVNFMNTLRRCRQFLFGAPSRPPGSD
jgi:hypothetical protein